MQTYEEAVSLAAAETLKARKLFRPDGSEISYTELIEALLRVPWYIKAAFWIEEAWPDVRDWFADRKPYAIAILVGLAFSLLTKTMPLARIFTGIEIVLAFFVLDILKTVGIWIIGLYLFRDEG